MLAGLFKRSAKPIVYSVLRTDRGWMVYASLPQKISPSDRIKVIDWFHSYRSEIQRMNPRWQTMFYASEGTYSLDVVPATDPPALIAQAVEAAQTWKQLELDYV